MAAPRLAADVLALAQLLRARGVALAPARVADALLALDALDPRRPAEGYWALRSVLVSRREELPVFERAFAELWGALGDLPEPAAPAGSAGSVDAAVERARAAVPGEEGEEPPAAGAAASAHELLWTADVAAWSAHELRRAHAAIEQIARRLPAHASRRMRAARRGERLDPRRTLLLAARTGGVPLRRAWRAPRRRPRRLLLVLDVSGSMQAYARVLLLLAHAALRRDARVEVFTFGTRLTRVTEALRAADPECALAAVRELVRDWSSGTRIGENVQALNERWGARGLTRGAVVAILSDGWERGDPALLARELARLRRAAHAVVWANPLAAEPGYRPLAGGMAAALPQLDALVPARDLVGLRRLADELAVRR